MNFHLFVKRYLNYLITYSITRIIIDHLLLFTNVLFQKSLAISTIMPSQFISSIQSNLDGGGRPSRNSISANNIDDGGGSNDSIITTASTTTNNDESTVIISTDENIFNNNNNNGLNNNNNNNNNGLNNNNNNNNNNTQNNNSNLTDSINEATAMILDYLVSTQAIQSQIMRKPTLANTTTTIQNPDQSLDGIVDSQMSIESSSSSLSPPQSPSTSSQASQASSSVACKATSNNDGQNSPCNSKSNSTNTACPINVLNHLQLFPSTSSMQSTSASTSAMSTQTTSTQSDSHLVLASLRNNLTAQNYLRYRRSKRQQQNENYSRLYHLATSSTSGTATPSIEDSENNDIDTIASFCGDLMKSPLPSIHPSSLPQNVSPNDPRVSKIQRNRRRISIYTRYLLQDKNPANRNVQDRISKLLRKTISDEIDDWDSIYFDDEVTGDSQPLSPLPSSSSYGSNSSSSKSTNPNQTGNRTTAAAGNSGSGLNRALKRKNDSSTLIHSGTKSSIVPSTVDNPDAVLQMRICVASKEVPLFKFEPFKFSEIKPSSDLCPNARSGHRIVADDFGNLYSFGGYNKNAGVSAAAAAASSAGLSSENSPLFRELWKFDWRKMKWEKLPAQGDEPEKLVSHCMAHFDDLLLIYGGTGLPYGENSSNRISAYNIDRHKWQLIKPESDASQLPQEMYGQAMAVDDENGEFYVIGGTNGHYYSLDVHKFNMYTRRWTLLYKHASFETEPGTRYRHEIALYKNKLYVFGGGTNSHCYSLQTLPVFDLSTCEWSNQSTRPDARGVSTSNARSSGLPMYPEARKCHSLSVINADCYICGGTSGKQVCPDVWHLNLETFQWTLIKPRMPYPVYFHSAYLDKSGQLTVFGGVDDVEGNSRNNKLCTMWVKVPPLNKIAIFAIRYYFQKGILDKKSLNETGLLEAKEVAKQYVSPSSSRACRTIY